ncbi:MAG: hypothetical protein ACJ8E0_06825 [Sphingomicrobium sp.]
MALGDFAADWEGLGRSMDSYHEHPSDFDPPASEAAPAPDVSAAIGTDERRMHVRAYNYWVSLLDGRDFPSIEDLEPANVVDFAGHSVLLDFTCGRDNPAIPYIGPEIRDECGLSDDTRTISDVPPRSLLSRLTDHYLQIIANRSPIGFEAEFVNQRSENICYRGILMPFSSDGDSIDFIYGVINWKKADEAVAPAATENEPEAFEDVDELLLEVESAPEPVDEPVAFEAEVQPHEHPAWDDGPSSEEPAEDPELADERPAAPVHFAWEDGPLADTDDAIELVLDENAGLADRLWAARETAESVKAGEGRTRAALYRALSLAYDFAVVAQQNPDEYAELLEESGVKAQARAPMTPIVKLVFGIDYDKARLTEFAAALSYAQRQEIGLGGFQDFIEKQPGGLKALVAGERQARRPAPKPDTKGEVARARLRSAPSISLAEVPATEEFAVVVTRRGADGTHEPVAILEDEALVEKAIRRAV